MTERMLSFYTAMKVNCTAVCSIWMSKITTRRKRLRLRHSRKLFRCKKRWV